MAIQPLGSSRISGAFCFPSGCNRSASHASSERFDIPKRFIIFAGVIWIADGSEHAYMRYPVVIH